MSWLATFGGGLLVAINAAIMGDAIFMSLQHLDLYGPKDCAIRTLTGTATGIVGYGGFMYIAMRMYSRV